MEIWVVYNLWFLRHHVSEYPDNLIFMHVSNYCVITQAQKWISRVRAHAFPLASNYFSCIVLFSPGYILGSWGESTSSKVMNCNHFSPWNCQRSHGTIAGIKPRDPNVAWVSPQHWHQLSFPLGLHTQFCYPGPRVVDLFAYGMLTCLGPDSGRKPEVCSDSIILWVFTKVTVGSRGRGISGEVSFSGMDLRALST